MMIYLGPKETKRQSKMNIFQLLQMQNKSCRHIENFIMSCYTLRKMKTNLYMWFKCSFVLFLNQGRASFYQLEILINHVQYRNGNVLLVYLVHFNIIYTYYSDYFYYIFSVYKVYHIIPIYLIIFSFKVNTLIMINYSSVFKI